MKLFQEIPHNLPSYYYYKYYNVKNGLINKIPIKVKFDDNFKNHVMTTEKPINFNVKQNYKELLTNILNINKINYFTSFIFEEAFNKEFLFEHFFPKFNYFFICHNILSLKKIEF